MVIRGAGRSGNNLVCLGGMHEADVCLAVSAAAGISAPSSCRTCLPDPLEDARHADEKVLKDDRLKLSQVPMTFVLLEAQSQSAPSYR